MAKQGVLQRIAQWGTRTSTKAAPRGRIPLATGGSGGTFADARLRFWGDETFNLRGYDTLGPVDYETAVGSVLGNSAVVACLSWIITAFAACTIEAGTGEGEDFTPNPSHPAVALMARPDPEFDAKTWWARVLADYWDCGNAIGNVVTDGVAGKPVGIQLLPAAGVTPYAAPGSDRYITEFRVRSANGQISVPSERVIHWRHFLSDATNPAWGSPPLRPALREIYCDQLASETGAALLRKPSPSGILTPDSSEVEVSDEALADMKRRVQEAASGENAGQIITLTAAAKFIQLGFNPRDLALDEARRKPEERICALFSISPIVVGLGAGLDKSTYANYETALKSAWQDCVIPLQDYLLGALQMFLQKAYNDTNLRLRWNRSQVEALQESDDDEHEDQRKDLAAGILTVDEIREARGLKKLPTSAQPKPTDPNQTDPNNAQVPTTPAKHAPSGARFKRSDASADIYAVADSMRRALARGEADALDGLATEWQKARRAIEARERALLDALREAERAGQGVPSSYPEVAQRLAQLSQQIDEEMIGLIDRGAAIIEDSQRQGVQTSLDYTQRLATAYAGTPPAGASVPWNALPAEAFESLFGFSSDGSPLAELLRDAAGDYAAEVRSGLLASLAQGMGPKQAAAKLSALSGTARARMETIARTEMLRANREASRRQYMQNADVLEGWVRLSAADTRTCPACWALHGTKHSVSEILPSHPGCRCSMIPAVKSWAALLGDDSLPDTRPEVPTGADLFAALGEAQQREILGPARYEQYAQNPDVFASFAKVSYDMQWGPTARTATVTETASV